MKKITLTLLPVETYGFQRHGWVKDKNFRLVKAEKKNAEASGLIV